MALTDEQRQRLRDAFQQVIVEHLKLEFERGLYDREFRHFLDAELEPKKGEIEIHMPLTLRVVPNDILVFRTLLGLASDDGIFRRVRMMLRGLPSLGGFMNTERLEELENAENWDFDTAETRPPVKAARAVVSVPFSRQDYEKVALCAEQTGERISEFIRQGALQRAADGQE